MIEAAPRSPHWCTVRDKWLLRNHFCRCCGTTIDLEVHHIKPYHLWPELELDITNFITLCREHHLLFGHLNSWSAYNPDVVTMVDDFFSRIKKRPTTRV